MRDIISSYTYTYDLVGNRIKVKEMVEGELSTVAYVYNPLYRLTSETRKNEAGEIKFHQAFTYDAVGNRLTMTRTDKEGTYITFYTYNEENQLLKKRVYQQTPPGLKIRYEVIYTYDEAGNQTSKTRNGIITTYRWDYENRLISVSNLQGTTTFTYTGDGKRTSKTRNGQTLRFLNDLNLPLVQVLIETDELANILTTYTRGNRLISRRSQGVTCFYSLSQKFCNK